MQLYNVYAWANPHHAADETPEWEAEIVAESVEEAYRIGLDQFNTERPDLDSKNYIIEASYN